jgi:hypothetical protein
MRDADAVNRMVVSGLGLGPVQFKNAQMQHYLDWLEGQSSGRPWRLDEQDLETLAVWVALTQHTKLSRAQATAIGTALRTGLRHEPEAVHWYISYDHSAARWRVAISPAVEMAAITIDLGVVRNRIAELRRQAEAEMQAQA